MSMCICTFFSVFVCVCVSVQPSGLKVDLVGHAEVLWSQQPTDHRLVALNGL